MNNTLIIFARRPELGKVKTRLAADIGNEKTLLIYSRLLEHTIAISIEVNSNTKQYWSEKSESNADYIQKGKDLGERMYNAFLEEQNSDKVCLIGTDTPSITASIIEDTFKALDNCDIVFGPSKDGGYYLVSTKKTPPKELFINKLWSHQHVLADAIENCKRLKLKVKLMPELLDIDTIADYNEWQKFKL